MRKEIKEITIKRWIELYKQGIPTLEIAKRSGVSQCTVYRYLDEACVLIKQNVITYKMVKEWIDLYKTGNVNCRWIAKKYGVARDTVARYLHMYGVKTSRKVPHLVEERI